MKMLSEIQWGVKVWGHFPILNNKLDMKQPNQL